MWCEMLLQLPSEQCDKGLLQLPSEQCECIEDSHIVGSWLISPPASQQLPVYIIIIIIIILF